MIVNGYMAITVPNHKNKINYMKTMRIYIFLVRLKLSEMRQCIALI